MSVYEVNEGSTQELAVEEIRYRDAKHEACYIYKGIPQTVICPHCDAQLYV